MMEQRRLIEIVEDDSDVAESLAALLDGYGYDTVRHENGERFLAAPTPGAACVLLDMRLPGMNGMEVLAAYRSAGATTPIVVVTGHGDVAMAVEALQGGAQDFIEKPYDDADLVARIERVDRRTAPDAKAAAIRVRFDRLTKREAEVMRLVVAGGSNKAIANEMELSPKTVEVHRARVMEKTEAKNLAHLIRMAIKIGVDPDLEAVAPPTSAR